MKILITGSSGYVGQSFCQLAEARHHELVLDKERAWLKFPDKIIYSDLDAIVHLAAAGVKAKDRANDDCMAVNFAGTKRFLLAIKNSTYTPKVFLAGSTHEETMAERLELWDDPYAVSKRMANTFAQDWSKHYHGEIIFGQIERCYGGGEVWKIAEQILIAVET